MHAKIPTPITCITFLVENERELIDAHKKGINMSSLDFFEHLTTEIEIANNKIPTIVLQDTEKKLSYLKAGGGTL